MESANCLSTLYLYELTDNEGKKKLRVVDDALSFNELESSLLVRYLRMESKDSALVSEVKSHVLFPRRNPPTTLDSAKRYIKEAIRLFKHLPVSRVDKEYFSIVSISIRI
jgi:hypothetical protein